MSLSPDDIEKIKKGIRAEIYSMFNEFGGKRDDRSDNPDHYTRATEIRNGDHLMLLTQLDNLRRRGERLMSEGKAVFAEHEAVKTRLFHALEDAHPDTTGFGPAHDYTRWVYWKGKYYYVSKDRDNAGDPGTDSRGDAQSKSDSPNDDE